MKKVAFETVLHGEPTFGVRVALWPESTLKDAETVLDRHRTIRIEFGYPLPDRHVFDFSHQGSWTRKDFVDAVVAKYREIGDAEVDDLWLETAYRDDGGVWRLGMGG
ncbi:MAG TPA: hypothetical protein VMU85_10805 [Stellaceae bacterium]|nr:hypothetical protein [Stellaceae bacterium]